MNALCIYVGVLGSLLLRWSLLDFESGDYHLFLSRWYDRILDDGWGALSKDYVTYPPPYVCLLCLCSYLPLPKIYAIKLISIFFDYMVAWLVFKIVRAGRPSGPWAWSAAILVLYLPTVWLNSSVWGQCDSIFTAALLGTLLSIMRARGALALAIYGLALALKPQAIFLGPLLGGLFFAGLLRWRWVWLPVVVYAFCGLPAVLAGRTFLKTILHYSTQTNLHQLTIGATNWYQWIPNSAYDTFFGAGLILSTVAGVYLMLATQVAFRGPTHNGPCLVLAAATTLVLVPYLLPGMHERYFFPADILCLVYAFYFPRRWYVAVLAEFASFFTYLPYLFGREPVPRPWLAFATTAALVILVWDFGRRALGPTPAPRERTPVS